MERAEGVSSASEDLNSDLVVAALEMVRDVRLIGGPREVTGTEEQVTMKEE